jgi:predicted Zn-dependent protease
MQRNRNDAVAAALCRRAAPHAGGAAWLQLFAVALAALLTGCSTVPITGRSQLLLVSSQQEMALGLSEFDKLKQNTKVSKDATWTGILQRVGPRIAAAAKKDLPNAQWEFLLFDDAKTINAFCLPGGKVAVYTGILPIAKDENGMATIIGHEVAHATARHGAERMSQAMLIQAGGAALNAAMESRGAANPQLFQQLYGIGTQVGVALPHSRRQELEADRMGLIYMARAGYDPHNAVEMWKRFAAFNRQQGNTPIAFLSTHPVDEKRIAQLQQLMPDALKEYTGAPTPAAAPSNPLRR